MSLSGPDGKPLDRARPTMTRQQKFNMIWMVYTLMTREERRRLRKSLRTLTQKLDLMYPEGMREGDIKNEIEQAANETVPSEQGHAEPQDAQVGPRPDIPAQPQGDSGSPEGAAPGGER